MSEYNLESCGEWSLIRDFRDWVDYFVNWEWRRSIEDEEENDDVIGGSICLGSRQ